MLVNTIQEVKKFAQVHKHLSLDSVRYALYNADEQVKKLLGEALYAEVDSVYTQTISPTPQQSKLLELCQRFTVLYMLADGFEEMRNQTGELGITQITDDSSFRAKASPVADAQQLYAKRCRNQYEAAENIIVFLETNQTNFPNWVSSSSYTENYQYLVRNATEFSHYVSYVSSRKTYLAIRSELHNAEFLTLKKITCQPLLDDLKLYQETKFRGGDLTFFPAEYAYLLDYYIKPLLANDTLFRALASLGIVLEGSFLYLTEYVALNKTNHTASFDTKEALREQLRANVDHYTDGLKFYLDTNINNLPKYRDSPCVEQSKRRNKQVCRNQNFKTFKI